MSPKMGAVQYSKIAQAIMSSSSSRPWRRAAAGGLARLRPIRLPLVAAAVPRSPLSQPLPPQTHPTSSSSNN